MKDRVLVRYLLAREQLAPVLNHVERLAKQEKWAEAIHALDDLKRKLDELQSQLSQLSKKP